MQIISAKELKERLKKQKVAEVGGIAFRIRKIPLLLVTEDSENLWDLARQGQEVLSQKLKALATNPSLSIMRRVILAGVVEPRFSLADDEPEAVPIDLLLSDSVISAGLFIEILQFSLEGW
ncbi:MAG: hypothetical protein HY548_02600 [Elusimicrobia bacterium]|nr:hypothetical protein [Elusimicrobiota bacterium]